MLCNYEHLSLRYIATIVTTFTSFLSITFATACLFRNERFTIIKCTFVKKFDLNCNAGFITVVVIELNFYTG